MLNAKFERVMGVRVREVIIDPTDVIMVERIDDTQSNIYFSGTPGFHSSTFDEYITVLGSFDEVQAKINDAILSQYRESVERITGMAKQAS